MVLYFIIVKKTIKKTNEENTAFECIDMAMTVTITTLW